MKIYFAHPCFNEEQREFKKVFLKKISAALSQTRYGNDMSIVDPFDYAPDVERGYCNKIRDGREH